MTSIQRNAHKLFNSLSKNNARFTNLLVLLYLTLGLIGILNHSMWRDELNPWLLARDSNSIVELFQNIKYEGHPGLWYIFLYMLNQFTHNPVFMQITHLIIATGFIYIFLRFSPFTRLQKLLFSFGYLPFYEYLVISRNYAIGILFVFAFCALYNTRKKSYLVLSLLLFLLANINAYCLFISVALGLALIFEYSLREKLSESLTASRTDLICSLTVFILGIVSSLAQLIPPADSSLQGGLSGWTLHFDLRHLAKALVRIWNSYIVILIPGDSNIEVVFFTVLALGLFVFTSTLLIRKPVAFFLYIFGTLEIISFTYVKFLGSARHYGHLYILLIVSLWIASYYSPSNLFFKTLPTWQRFQKLSTPWLKFVEKYKTTFILVILSAQLAAGIVAFSRDLFVPYSASRAVSRYIQSQQLDKMFIVGSRDATISPLCGYLNRKIYYPERQGLGSFVLFNSKRKEVDAVAVLEQVSQLINQQNHTNILLILNDELKTSRADLRVSLLAKFTKTFIFNEKYYLYEVNPAVNRF